VFLRQRGIGGFGVGLSAADASPVSGAVCSADTSADAAGALSAAEFVSVDAGAVSAAAVGAEAASAAGASAVSAAGAAASESDAAAGPSDSRVSDITGNPVSTRSSRSRNTSGGQCPSAGTNSGQRQREERRSSPALSTALPAATLSKRATELTER